jgi:hypothetical protein
MLRNIRYYFRITPLKKIYQWLFKLVIILIIIFLIRKALRNGLVRVPAAEEAFYDYNSESSNSINEMERAVQEYDYEGENQHLAYKDVFNDMNVNTSSYLSDYHIAYSRMYNMRTNLNEQSRTSPHKTVIMMNRARLSLRKREYLILDRSAECVSAASRPLNVVDECPRKNCRLTCAGSEWPNADAILFNERELVEQMRSIEEGLFVRNTMGKHRGRRDQIWILRKGKVKRT